jgi:hypothetical protein
VSSFHKDLDLSLLHAASASEPARKPNGERVVFYLKSSVANTDEDSGHCRRWAQLREASEWVRSRVEGIVTWKYIYDSLSDFWTLKDCNAQTI